MRNSVIVVLLLILALQLKAQTLYTRTDSIAITSDSVALQSGPFRGSIQWQHSLNGQLWENLLHETDPLLKVSKFDEGFYRAQITDETCLPVNSDTAVVVSFKTGNPSVIDPDEVIGATFIDRDDRDFTFISTSGITIPPNTVFLENDKESDIRVVSGVIYKGDTIIANTLPGKMEDLFVNQEIILSTEMVAPTANPSFSEPFAIGAQCVHPVEIISLNIQPPKLNNAPTAEDSPVITISENLSGETLYNKNGMELTITDGYFKLDAILKSEFNFQQSTFEWNELPTGELKSCKFYIDGEKSKTETKLILEAKTNGPVTIDETFVLKQDVYKTLFKFQIGEIPVWMYVRIDLMAKVKGNFSNTISVTGGTTSEVDVNLSADYLNGIWSSNFSGSKLFHLFAPEYSNHINYSAQCEVYPRIEIFYYNSLCSYLEIAPYISEKMILSNSGNYSAELVAGVEARTGIDGNILGYGIPGFSRTVNSNPDTLYREPVKMEVVSGDNQLGAPGELLAMPIVIRVLNSADSALANAPVHFYTSSGSVDSLTHRTNVEGLVSVKWTLGDSPGNQSLEAFLKDGNDAKMNNSVITITAASVVMLPTVETTAVTEIYENSAMIMGNVIKDGGADITLRGFCWNTTGNPTTDSNIEENGVGTGVFQSRIYGLQPGTTYYVRAYAINSLGTSYGNQLSFRTLFDGCATGFFTDARDGKYYPTITFGSQTWMAENLAYLPTLTPVSSWSETTPCYYVNNLATYGVLYNWPAAMSACPAGWHLPGDTEWTALAEYFGGVEVAGGKLKSVTGWLEPNVGATNESCFTALPGGGFSHGFYFSTEQRAYWWTSTEIDATIVWARGLFYNIPAVYRHYFYREVGYSVRCVKN
jgi:uncharacterized protein (TIGR02145 family)